MSHLPPLLPKVDAILVLDTEGNRLAGKYYGSFLQQAIGDKTPEDLRSEFELQLHQKIVGIAARPDAAEVVTVQGRSAVFTGAGGDVRIVHVGPPGESELVLAHLCEGMYDALLNLMGGTADRTMVLDNLELVFLLIDEHCDGGIILEVDGNKLASAVLLRDEEGPEMMGASSSNMMAGMPPPQQGMPAGAGSDLTIGQAFREVRNQIFSSS